MREGAGPVLAGLMAAGLFGASAVGFRGGIIALPSGGFLIRATTILVFSLTLQSLILMVWMALFDRRALAGSFRVWRGSLGAGFLGAFASQFWFIGFALTSAANVRTLALIEVIFAQALAFWLFGQRADRRQIIGSGIVMLGVGLLLRLQA
jgi:drug/metabolite transporter (DMT)-like permease